MMDVRVKKLKWLLEHENDSVGILECFEMKNGKKEAAKRIHEALWNAYREGVYEKDKAYSQGEDAGYEAGYEDGYRSGKRANLYED